jgi:hypothetical protein
MKPSDLVLLILSAFLLVCAWVSGAMLQEKQNRKEAVAAGVAHWTVDTEGKTKFEYNK